MIVRQIEIEHRRRAQRNLQIRLKVGGREGVQAVGGCCVVVAVQRGQLEQRLARLAEHLWRCWRCGAIARFRIEQDGFNDGSEVAVNTAAVVREYLCDAADVRGRRIAGGEALDQLPRDERCDVRMVGKDRQALVEIVLAAVAGRQRLRRTVGVVAAIAEQRLRVGFVVMVVIADHRRVVGRRPVAARRVAVEAAGVAPPGEHLRVCAHGRLRIRRNRLAGGVGLWVAAGRIDRREIRMAQHQPDREQLHDLARIVFVRVGTECWIAGFVAPIGQHLAHRRAARDVIEQRRKRAGTVDAASVVPTDAVTCERVVVLGECHRIATEHALRIRCHHDLAECPRHALAQLIRRRDGRLQPCLQPVVLAGIGQHRNAVGLLDVGTFGRGRHRQLLIDPLRIADSAQVRDLGGGRSERGHTEKARGFGV